MLQLYLSIQEFVVIIFVSFELNALQWTIELELSPGAQYLFGSGDTTESVPAECGIMSDSQQVRIVGQNPSSVISVCASTCDSTCPEVSGTVSVTFHLYVPTASKFFR
eukprot:UN01571